jgi:hypothetical protein
MARPRFHALVTAPVAWAAHRQWGPLSAAGVLVTGVFIDLDHLVDYAWTRLRGARSHYFAPLHGWELAAAVTVWSAVALRNPEARPLLPDRLVRHRSLQERLANRQTLGGLLAGLAAGWLVHLAQDVVSNRPRHPLVYALVYRMRHGFRREATGWGEHTNFHGWSNLPWYQWF